MIATTGSGASDGTEPFRRDAAEIEPTADILGWETEVPRQFGYAPAFDDGDMFHAQIGDTKRVVRQHYPQRDSCDSKGMSPGDRLRELRTRARLSVEELADAVGLAASSVRAHENGQNGIRATMAQRYATALGVTPEEILFTGGKAQTAPRSASTSGGSRRVPVLGVVQAGAWAEIADHDPEPTEWVAFEEPQYARAQLFALIVRGTSVNRFYPEGSRVVCIPAHESGVQEGDFVVVRRRRGSFAETTLKQVEVGPDGQIELWPRSDDPQFQEPLRMDNVRDADEGAEIIAVVVAKYEVGRAGRGPLLDLR